MLELLIEKIKQKFLTFLMDTLVWRDVNCLINCYLKSLVKVMFI